MLHGASLKGFLAITLAGLSLAAVGVFAEEEPDLPSQAEAGIEIAEKAAGGVGDDSIGEEVNGEDPQVLGHEENGSGTGHETCFAATEPARGVLEGLLDGSFFEDLNLPDQADAGLDAEGQEGVAESLEAINNCGMGDDGEADINEGQPEGTPQGPPEGTPQGPPEGVPSGTPGGVPSGPPDSEPEDVPAAPPEGVPDGPPEGVPSGPPEGVPAGPSEE